MTEIHTRNNRLRSHPPARLLDLRVSLEHLYVCTCRLVLSPHRQPENFPLTTTFETEDLENAAHIVPCLPDQYFPPVFIA